MEEIRFIKDDLEQERQANIKALMSLLDEKQISNDVFVAKRFMVSVMHAAKSIKDRKLEEKNKIKFSSPKVINRLEMPMVHQEATVLEQPKLPEIPIPPPMEEEAIHEDERFPKEYPLIMSANQVLAKASVNLEDGKLKYMIIEPGLDPRVFERAKDLLKRKLRKDINVLKDDKLLTNKIKKAYKKYKIEFNTTNFENIKYYLFRDYLHFGRIDPLMNDRSITSIICEGINKPVRILYNGSKIDTNISYVSNDDINNLLYKFAKIGSKILNKNNTILDVVINGFRIEGTLGLEEISSRFTATRISA